MVVCFRISDSPFLSVLMFQRASATLFWGGTNWGPAPTPSSYTNHFLSLVSEYHPASSWDSILEPSLSSKVRASLPSTLVIGHFCALNPGANTVSSFLPHC